jgi:thioredoxin reductase (NADPH)
VDIPLHDCLVIGGGPAGLSAAIYAARFLRDTVVVDHGRGRSSFEQLNDNYLGFPDGIKVRDLRALGRRQAENFGAQFVDSEVRSLRRVATGGAFAAETEEGDIFASTVILATGVTDLWPDLPHVEQYVGRSLFWCITCDGFRTMRKRLVLFGKDDEAATTACQFLNYTRQIVFVGPPGKIDCSAHKVRAMIESGISIVEGEPDCVLGPPGAIEGLRLRDGRTFEADLLFSLLGSRPNNRLALDLGVACDSEGYVLVDEEGYTNVPGVFSAGDLSRMHTHQVIAAAHEGAEAAQTANYYLYARFQQNET